MTRGLPHLLVVAALVPLLAAIWPSDRWPLLALLAYVPPALSLAAAAAALAFFARRHPHPAWLASAFLALSISVTALAVDNRRLLVPEPVGAGVRVIHWNIGRSSSVGGDLRDLHADILCLSECTVPYAAQLGVGWNEVSLGSLHVLSPLPIARRREWETEGIKGLHVSVGTTWILLVDVVAWPTFHRLAAMRELSRWIDEAAPDLVVGDFNTPAGAFSLRGALSSGFRDAYSLAGRGLAYSWPSVLPCMKIDHFFVRHGLTPVDFVTGFSIRSDHRWQECRLRSPAR